MDPERAAPQALSLGVPDLGSIAVSRVFVGYGDGRRSSGNGEDPAGLLAFVRKDHRHGVADREAVRGDIPGHQAVQRKKHQRAALVHDVRDGEPGFGVYGLDPAGRRRCDFLRAVFLEDLFQFPVQFSHQGLDIADLRKDRSFIHGRDEIAGFHDVAVRNGVGFDGDRSGKRDGRGFFRRQRSAREIDHRKSTGGDGGGDHVFPDGHGGRITIPLPRQGIEKDSYRQDGDQKQEPELLFLLRFSVRVLLGGRFVRTVFRR